MGSGGPVGGVRNNTDTRGSDPSRAWRAAPALALGWLRLCRDQEGGDGQPAPPLRLDDEKPSRAATESSQACRYARVLWVMIGLT
jgi:hypothetical protein